MEKLCKKPVLSQKDRDRANGVWKVMNRCRGNVKKAELCRAVGWDVKTHDRQIREVISIVAKKFPIISLSGDEGYRMAKFLSDVPDVENQLADLQSRINELKARKAPLEQFLSDADKYRRTAK